jgi:UDP-N-acetylglucosamine--N-acetylmuramyl-(pentapeptide) pyrophosphoryl-undecaprenol N-acetylglucosamine transferase
MMGGTVRTPLRIAIGGGGTGGHTFPALATLDALARLAELDILWIGSRGGTERLVARERGLRFRWIPTGKLRRELTPRTLVDLALIPLGVAGAYYTMRTFRPDIVFATGGYVSVPVVIGAWLACLPIVIHEQTAVAGLATRIAAPFADVVAISWESTRAHLRARTIVHTGLPIRRDLLGGDADRARRHLGLTDDLPIVYITGGALGAHAINETVRQSLPQLLAMTQLVHQCGPASVNGDLPRLQQARAQLPEYLQRRYVVRERFNDELADIYAAAHLVIGRAGASTVAEIAALGKPALFIPLPGARGDEQTANARLLADRGAAIIVPQEEFTPCHLVELVRHLLDDPAQLRAMGELGRSLVIPDAAERLAMLILRVAHRERVDPAPRAQLKN